MKNDFAPPPHLSARSKSLWASVVPDKARTPGRLAMLQAALESLDRADLATAEIATSGMTSTTKSTGAIHVHPLVKVERESRQQFAKLWALMGLQFSREDSMDLEHWLRRQRGERDKLERLING